MLLAVALLMLSASLIAQDINKKELQTFHPSPHIRGIEVSYITKEETDIPCTIQFWDSKDILIECEVSDQESLANKEESPYEIKTYEQDSILILEITDTGRTIFQGGKEIKLGAKYRMLIPAEIEVLNPELIKK